MRKLLLVLVTIAVAAAPLGCASMSKTEKGAVIGATGGAVVGGVIGNAAGNTALGAIIGAAIGGAGGAVIGHYMDEQAAEMERDLEGAKIERIGEGIKITFASGLMFDTGKSDLRPEAQTNLTDLAVILKKYDDTNILIEGHTDSDGSEEYNLGLSDRRAKAVSGFLAVQGVANARMSTFGYGEAQPIADNSTPQGKQTNRRVEVAIIANEELKKAAEKQAQGE